MGNDRRGVVTVMTQNMYEGTNFQEISAAQTPDEFFAAVTMIYENILATKPDERAAAMASEIQKKHPDLVALHEASMLRTGPLSAPPPPSAATVEMDLITSLLKELDGHYELVKDPAFRGHWHQNESRRRSSEHAQIRRSYYRPRRDHRSY
jgi:hypothetical protein